jgi:hypothetical protein
VVIILMFNILELEEWNTCRHPYIFGFKKHVPVDLESLDFSSIETTLNGKNQRFSGVELSIAR